MSLELLNTGGTLITVIIVATAASAALVQLRHLRAGNQINAMLAIGEELNARPSLDAAALTRNRLMTSLNNPEFRTYSVARHRGQSTPDESPEYVELRAASHLVANTYEELGILVKRGIVDKEMFLDLYAWQIVGRWKRMEAYIALTREAAGQNALFENFECLAVISED